MSGIISLLCPGSIPERDGDKLYNTCTVFSPTGAMLGKYRKVSVDAVSIVLFLTFLLVGFLARVHKNGRLEYSSRPFLCALVFSNSNSSAY